MASLENELAYEREVRELREENARLAALVQQYHPAYLGLPHVVRERDEARAEAKKYHDALVSRHGGEPVALLEELDASRAEVARLEGLILDWDGGGESPSSDALYAEARRIRAQREEGR